MGCYGSTEPATEIERESARLNARGTANSGPASSVFEYWPTGRQDLTRRTPRLQWPAGASGPIASAVSGLRPGTPYSFRFCGADRGQTDVCAQTRAFATANATADIVRGSYSKSSPDDSFRASVDATANPPGDPEGTLNTSGGPTGGTTIIFTSSRLTCMNVAGRRGAVGAVGQIRREPGGTVSGPATALMTVEDGIFDRPDTVHVQFVLDRSNPPPPDCVNASFTSNEELAPDDGDLIVVDVQGG